MKKNIIIGGIIVVLLAGAVSAFECGVDTVVDIEGNEYNTVEIGTQCWMKENMRTTKYADGSSITRGPIGATWDGNDNGYYACPPNFGNTAEDCNAVSTLGFGYVYQWSAAMKGSVAANAQGICPSGWHIPSHDEYTTLEREVCTSGTCATDFPYDSTTTGWLGTNEGISLSSGGTSGFSALFPGYRHSNGAFGYRNVLTNWWSSVQNYESYAWRRGLQSGHWASIRYYDVKSYAFSVRCIYGAADSTPTYTNFTSSETTNFSEGDVTNITSLTLGITGKGKIAFPSNHSINADNENYDTNIKIEDSVIFVNSSALHSSFNSSATLTFYNVDCNKPYVFYSETASTFAAILSENQRCPESLCSNILCADSTLTVDVEHFTGFAAGTDANLTIEAQSGVFYPLDPIEFTAEYINSTDGTPISGECNITFDDDWGTAYTMDFDSIDYNYTKSFAVVGLHEYNVTCSSANFVTLEANDTKLVTSVDIPEFSVLTLGVGFIAVLIGLVIVRKRKDSD
ncbi:MAG: fibrobacter succinogenes major paralogous domain-containing protein [Nanoarchaeota archaeon]|nr:fibrobacter succinogenes major paralogous domain-containing protein [Nanoarchaeota archaeon]